MRTLYRTLTLLCGLLLMACATPPEVKQLSTAQIGYFDSAIEAVTLQSETLVLAAQNIADRAEKEIAAREAESVARLKNLVVETIPGQPVERRNSIADDMFKSLATISTKAAKSRAKLARDISTIRAKNDELQTYIARMKDVQIALDAYIQSEKAGEKVVQGVLKKSGVDSLLGDVNTLLPKVTGTIGDIRKLIGGLGGST
jgi:hypothetical protein